MSAYVEWLQLAQARQAVVETMTNLARFGVFTVLFINFRNDQQVGFTLSQATKTLRESRGIALLYFRPLH